MKCGALFSGIGGFCIGFEAAGFNTAWAVDVDEHACETYRSNIATENLLNRSVTELNVSKLDLEPVDILHAGFPCQSFSQAGTRQGFRDPRGQLFYEVIRIVESFKDRQPKVLVLENAPFIRHGEGGAWFIELQRAIQAAGYWFGKNNSCELNAFELTELPQQRNRLFMVAFSMKHFRSGRFDFPNRPHSAPKRLADFIGFDEAVPQEYYLNDENRYARMISKVAENKRQIYQLRKYEVRSKPAGTCPTLTANMGLGGHNVPFVFGPRGLRKLTEHECAKLQGFPETFQFPASVPRAKRYTQVGNAVAVPVARLLALKVREKLLASAI